MNTLAKPETKPAEEKKSALAIASVQIAGYINKGSLNLPDNYSVGNALKEAWVIIQSTVNSDRKPALQVCTQDSVVLAMMDMAIQGLSPHKNQCYFIVYGDKLACQRSYFGDMALAKCVLPGLEFYYNVVREDEEFIQEFTQGKNTIQHRRGISTDKKIIGAYCGAILNGVDRGADVMDIERIKKSWSMSKTYKTDNAADPHNKFDDEFSLRTVIRHYCKPIIAASDDSELMKAVLRQEIESIEGLTASEAALEANVIELQLPAPRETTQENVSENEEAPSSPGGLPY